MPRATLFKPQKRAKLDKNPLWREVFLQSSSDEDDSDGDDNELEVYNMYKDTLLAKGISGNKERHLLASAQSQPNKQTKSGLTLPPINGHKGTAKKKGKRADSKIQSAVISPPKSRGESRKNKLRTAAQNFAETGIKYQPMQDMINI